MPGFLFCAEIKNPESRKGINRKFFTRQRWKKIQKPTGSKF
jgi:hypothetical protein